MSIWKDNEKNTVHFIRSIFSTHKGMVQLSHLLLEFESSTSYFLFILGKMCCIYFYFIFVAFNKYVKQFRLLH